VNHYRLLGIDPGATDEEIRRAYRGMRQLFDPDSPILYGLYRPADVQAALTRLRRAYETLVDPQARRRYDRRLYPTGHPNLRRAAPRRSVAPVAPPADPLKAAGIDPDMPFDGNVLKRVREASGIALQEIAEQTKISMFTLRCIEADQFADLPAPVYLRGFLKQFAQHLRIDADRVVREYSGALARWQAEKKKRRPW
jgi:flagellar biosynthesis protein FlhG